MAVPAMDTSVVADEDALRAETYILLAMLLSAPPKRDVLDLVGDLPGDESPVGTVIRALSAAARAATPAVLEREYHDLFIGTATGELIPYASYYLTGSLYTKPLASLRVDMARLGIARSDKASEPEDHIAAECEMMAGLILGSFSDVPAPLDEQRRFFESHLAPWAARFFADLEAAQAATFYMPVGRLGGELMEIETQAFEMA